MTEVIIKYLERILSQETENLRYAKDEKKRVKERIKEHEKVIGELRDSIISLGQKKEEIHDIFTPVTVNTKIGTPVCVNREKIEGHEDYGKLSTHLNFHRPYTLDAFFVYRGGTDIYLTELPDSIRFKAELFIEA